MEEARRLQQRIGEGEYDKIFSLLYPRVSAQQCRTRYVEALEQFERHFGLGRKVVLVSAPGRTEIGGNHTDHQRGRVLAGAVNLDILCVASPNGEEVIRVHSEGYDPDKVELDNLSPRESDRESSVAVVRGVADWFASHGHKVTGFDAYTTSNIMTGSGLSSSAAFEVALGNTLRVLGGCDVSNEEIAIAGQYAENVHFGKPCGLMDQMASSVGGLVGINFADPHSPSIRAVHADLDGAGYHLCIVDTRGSHADLTGDYAEITEEMKAVAACFGKEVLREVSEVDFYRNLARVRAAAGDRSVLRAMHFFADDSRVPLMIDALEQERFDEFLQFILQSGRSSFQWLQNGFSTRSPRRQGLTLALALSQQVLEGRGAWRIHGGGFAGTIQAFVPSGLLEHYEALMADVFGQNACAVLTIRPVGGAVVTPFLVEGEEGKNG